MLSSVRIAPSALGLTTSASSDRISSAPTTLPPTCVGKLLRLGGIDVGDRQICAPSAQACSATPVATLPAPCMRDVQPVDAVLAERALHRGLDAEEHAERRVRPGIAADAGLSSGGRPATNLRLAADLDHVGDAHADVLGGDVAAAELVDRLAERGEQLRASWSGPPAPGSPTCRRPAAARPSHSCSSCRATGAARRSAPRRVSA